MHIHTNNARKVSNWFFCTASNNYIQQNVQFRIVAMKIMPDKEKKSKRENCKWNGRKRTLLSRKNILRSTSEMVIRITILLTKKSGEKSLWFYLKNINWLLLFFNRSQVNRLISIFYVFYVPIKRISFALNLVSLSRIICFFSCCFSSWFVCVHQFRSNLCCNSIF